jgi:glyoxylase-like metal-dependent hydrolase (beta-lactamase superfamily II)
MNPNVFHFNVGAVQGFVLNDGSDVDTVEDLIVNPRRVELEQIAEEYSFKLDEIPAGFNNLLLRTEEQIILVDAGNQAPDGQLWKGLEELGIDPAEIDTIVITHSDWDHLGGILDEDGGIVFSRARYVMLEESWQYWETEESRSALTMLNKWTRDSVSFAWRIFSEIKDSLRLVKAEEEFLPGFKLMPAPGHRMDHAVLQITSSGEHLLHVSDALLHPLFMAHRDWVSTYDANPAQAIETKVKLLNFCATRNAIMFGAHFPFPGLGHVREGDQGWKWLPID